MILGFGTSLPRYLVAIPSDGNRSTDLSLIGTALALALRMARHENDHLWTHGTLRETLAEVREQTEREMIDLALAHTGGNVTGSAELLGISRRGIQVKIKRWEFDPTSYPVRN